MRIMLTVLLLALQGLDVALHIATDQFEPIRFVSNLIVAGGAILILVAARQSRIVGLVTGASYFLLNLVFLAQNGMTNPGTGALRVPLFGFVFFSVLLLVLCVMRAMKTEE